MKHKMQPAGQPPEMPVPLCSCLSLALADLCSIYTSLCHCVTLHVFCILQGLTHCVTACGLYPPRAVRQAGHALIIVLQSYVAPRLLCVSLLWCCGVSSFTASSQSVPAAAAAHALLFTSFLLAG